MIRRKNSSCSRNASSARWRAVMSILAPEMWVVFPCSSRRMTAREQMFNIMAVLVPQTEFHFAGVTPLGQRRSKDLLHTLEVVGVDQVLPQIGIGGEFAFLVAEHVPATLCNNRPRF